MPKKHKAKVEKRQGICVYCGRIDLLSEDHIIPQCLFPGKCPSDVPKVYACERCNNIVKSANDTYLRDVLFMDMHSAQHPIVQELWGKFARAVHRNQSSAARQALPTSQLVALHTPSGLFREWAYELTLPRGRVTEVLSMMTRGLYQFYVGKKLPQTSQFEVARVQGNIEPAVTTAQTLLQQGAPCISIGDGEVFQCIFACWAPKHEVSLWFLCFYKSVVFTVVTNRQLAQSTHM